MLEIVVLCIVYVRTEHAVYIYITFLKTGDSDSYYLDNIWDFSISERCLTLCQHKENLLGSDVPFLNEPNKEIESNSFIRRFKTESDAAAIQLTEVQLVKAQQRH